MFSRHLFARLGIAIIACLFIQPCGNVSQHAVAIANAETVANTIEIRIVDDDDDAEEEGPDGTEEGDIHVGSSDLELVEDWEPESYGTQTVGMRFRAVDVPQSATISRASITFLAVDADDPNTNDNPSSLTIAGEDSSDPQPYVDILYNISSRPRTNATVNWTPSPWTAGEFYATPNISAVVQEIVDRSDWQAGDNMAFVVMGSGSRSAASYDGSADYAPRLHIELKSTATTHMTYLPLIRTVKVEGRLVNGDFESGPTGWDQYSSNGFPLIINDFSKVGITPHSGSWAVWLGGFPNETSSIRQQVTAPLPPEPLHYWFWIATKETLCGYDRAMVLLNNVIVAQHWFCSETQTNGWRQHTVDLTAYAGEQVMVEIRMETNTGQNSNFFVDDIGFGAQSTSADADFSMPHGQQNPHAARNQRRSSSP